MLAFRRKGGATLTRQSDILIIVHVGTHQAGRVRLLLASAPMTYPNAKDSDINK